MRVYRSKIDRWLVVVLATTALVCLFTAVIIVVEEGLVGLPVSAFTILVGIGLPVWLTLSTSYRFSDTHLLIKSGPFHWRVPLREITDVRPSRLLLSSPALSIDRLRIDYGRRFILISPLDREEFLLDLKARIPEKQ